MVETLFVARVGMVTAGLVLLGLAAWANWRREAPALRPFVVLVGVVGGIAVVDGAAAADLTALSLVWVAAFVAIPCAFTWFVVEYYGLPHLVSPVRRAAFLAPAVVGVAGGAALILSPSASGSMAGGASTAPSAPSILGLAVVAERIGLYYAGGVMLVGVALLGRTVARYDYLDSRLGGVLSFVAVWPWLAYVLTPALATRLELGSLFGLTASGYGLSAVAVGFALTRGGLFDAAPAAGTLGPRTVLAELDAAAVVVDRDERVVRMNGSAREVFGVDRATGDPLPEAVGTDLETLRSSDTVELSVSGGSRHFEASVSPVRDRYDRQPGHAVVLTDVTRERLRSQRLTVLNRVLRHNLRNRMSAIIGRAEMVGTDGHDDAGAASDIIDSADDLLTLGDRARQIEQMLAVSPDVDAEVSLADLAEDVVSSYRDECPDAAVSVDIDESLTLAVDERVLSTVLDNLVENALVHNDAPTPIVSVSARVVDDGSAVRLSVSDNGPGVPEHERAVVESGTETALDHGSGLGLWAVKWGMVRLGGELEFRDNEPEGTVVSMRLARRDRDASEQPAPKLVEAN